MVAAPDTFVVTAPENAAVSIDDVLITPTGGSQGRLADKVASGSGITSLVAGTNLTGGTITTTGTIALNPSPALTNLNVSGTITALPIGSGLTLTAGTLASTAGGGSVTSVITQGGPFLANGTITGAGTISNSTASLAAHGIIIAEGTGAAVATVALTNGQLLIGATGADPAPQTMSGDATINAGGTITVSKIGGNTLAANTGAVLNNGTVQINNSITLAGTAAGTLAPAPASGTTDVIINMPAAGGTVTVNPVPAFSRQRMEMDIKQGATFGVLNFGTVVKMTGAITSFTLTPTAGAVDRLSFITPDGTSWVPWAINQGATL